MHLIVILCLAFLSVNCQQSNNDNLIAVVQVFRHGHRTPTGFYTNDPYSNSSRWKGLDLGQLTNVGRRQHYELGQFTRKRYNKWLPARYDKNDIYVQTTDVDRTHMSAQTNLYGLYPAKGDQIWKRFLDWQAIPVHPSNPDVFLSYAACSAYSQEFGNVLASEQFAELNKKYTAMFKLLSHFSGDNITDLFEAYSIYDALKSEDVAGFRLPRWTKLFYPKLLKTLSGIVFKATTQTELLQRYFVGPLLDEVVKYFETIGKNQTSTQKYQIYSGHDTNIASLLNTFGVFDPPYPPAFASSIYIELRRKENLYVNVWSKNDDEFKLISVRGCDLDCPLSEFKERLGDIIVDVATRNAECEKNGAIKLDAKQIERNAFIQKLLL